MIHYKDGLFYDQEETNTIVPKRWSKREKEIFEIGRTAQMFAIQYGWEFDERDGFIVMNINEDGNDLIMDQFTSEEDLNKILEAIIFEEKGSI